MQAGIQHVDATINFNSWTPAFAGVTNSRREKDPKHAGARTARGIDFLSRLVYILVYKCSTSRENVMKIEIGSYEAKTKLPELLRQVKTGKSFTITNRGQAIADLVPSAGVRSKDKVAAAKKLKAFMLADPVRGVNIKRLIEEGRA